MLASMVKVDNVNGFGKVLRRQIPNPLGAVAHHHLLLGTAPTPLLGFPVQALAELLGGGNGAGIGSGIGSTDRVSLLIPRRLGEDAPQLDFPRMRRLTLDFALPTHGLFLHHRDSRPIHLHVEDGNRLSGDDGKVRGQGFLDLLSLALSDIGADPLRRALHEFGGHLQASEPFHLFTALIEGGRLAHQRLHAPYPRRKLGILDVQFDISGELAGVTVWAPVVGTGDFHRAYGGQHGLAAQPAVVGRLSTGTRPGPLVGGRNWELQQLAEARGASPMQGRAQGGLDRLQIRAAVFPALSKDTAQKLVYFSCHLLMDGSSRFFSCAVQPPPAGSTGRRAQILSLRETSSALSFWKR